MAENIVLAEMTWPEVQEATEDRKAVALVPLGATEAHGPHLPLATATYLAIDAAKRTARKLKVQGIKAVVFPNISYSVCERSSGLSPTIGVNLPWPSSPLAEKFMTVA